VSRNNCNAVTLNMKLRARELHDAWNQQRSRLSLQSIILL
jgi:hypothetical protein